MNDLYAALGRARIGAIRSIARFGAGQHNRSYVVVTGRGRYVLRVYQYKTPREFAFELAVLKQLRGLPVPHLYSFADKSWIRIGSKYAILYDYLPGTHLSRFTPSQLREVGAFIGRFHRRLEGFRWTHSRHRFYDLPDQKVNELMRAIGRSHIPYQRLLPKIVSELRATRPSPRLPQGPIHVDIKPENVLFHRSHLSGVVDFDNSYLGPLLLDLCKSMAWFGVQSRTFVIDDALQILRGYCRVRRLTPVEQASLLRTLRFAFLSHVFVDYYMRARGYTSAAYFRYIVHDLYTAYRSFRMDEHTFSEYMAT